MRPDSRAARTTIANAIGGSEAYAQQHADELRALVLLDFVAEKGEMRIPREESSHIGLWDRLRSAAAAFDSAPAASLQREP